MFLTGKHIPRRTFLRGMGATVALPLLDAMVPAGRAWAPNDPIRFVAIEQVLYRYAYALDARDYEALDEVFSPDAGLHTSGGTSMSIPGALPCGLGIGRLPRGNRACTTLAGGIGRWRRANRAWM